MLHWTQVARFRAVAASAVPTRPCSHSRQPLSMPVLGSHTSIATAVAPGPHAAHPIADTALCSHVHPFAPPPIATAVAPRDLLQLERVATRLLGELQAV
eukprot:CAMPEP_0174714180 /NCGR_PEP_ID=MMETSP1094-20130205/16982_1 /TAXON_ID=156173 /ORGANISM="Chrysochromulina brevifilum, Strain UTEX LB 985" /LENGTH=98 /DNA_ID=CAMNT_0015913475 /DNA_START=150 /DNA_END=446 /DNA_ORIENTATION=-